MYWSFVGDPRGLAQDAGLCLFTSIYFSPTNIFQKLAPLTTELFFRTSTKRQPLPKCFHCQKHWLHVNKKIETCVLLLLKTILSFHSPLCFRFNSLDLAAFWPYFVCPLLVYKDVNWNPSCGARRLTLEASQKCHSGLWSGVTGCTKVFGKKLQFKIAI